VVGDNLKNPTTLELSLAALGSNQFSLNTPISSNGTWRDRVTHEDGDIISISFDPK
jgi:hypothetical protein